MNDNDRSILAIAMTGHGMVHAFEMSIPVFLTYWMVTFDVGSGTMGTVVAVGYALFGIGSLPAGIAADVYGSKRLVIGCLLGMGLGFLLLGFGGIAGLTAALLVWGAGASLYHPSGLRLISTGIEDRGSAFAFHGMAGNLGITLGPLIAVLLLMTLPWRTVAAAFAIPAIIAAIAIALVDVDETAAVADGDDSETVNSRPGDSGTGDPRSGGSGTGDPPSVREVLTDSRTLFAGLFAIVFAIVVLQGFFYRGILTFLPEILSDSPVLDPVVLLDREVAPSRYVYVALLCVGMGGQYVGGRLSDRYPPEQVAIGAFLLLAALSLAFVPAAAVGVVAVVGVSLLLGFVLFGEQPLMQAVVAEYTGSGDRGIAYGYMYLANFGIGSLGAAVSGAILAYTTQRALFLLLAIVPAAAAVASATLFRYGRG
ncbi:Sugar phosphate permease [Halopenitus malekzadehii]|uniref:Sugar phosphate permease n=1 Tax=Halopenitus malekzadehii TaxID=1267564 RepID=A0A1H6I058_9EURY|nr:MFS transporter [Halopenitus malekzadehii]SEH40788.1 Sugar phosphate permease [Halopenitus malekzadehii]